MQKHVKRTPETLLAMAWMGTINQIHYLGKRFKGIDFNQDSVGILHIKNLDGSTHTAQLNDYLVQTSAKTIEVRSDVEALEAEWVPENAQAEVEA